MTNEGLCLCGSTYHYLDCCAIAHKSLKDVQTAEQLMRSRYVAFVMADIDFLMKSHHSSTSPIGEELEIENFAKSVSWLKLRVLKVKQGTYGNTKGYVEFKAYYKDGVSKKCIHGKSNFIYENNCWYYLDER